MNKNVGFKGWIGFDNSFSWNLTDEIWFEELLSDLPIFK